LDIQKFSLAGLRVFLKIRIADELEDIAIGTIKKKKVVGLRPAAFCCCLRETVFIVLILLFYGSNSIQNEGNSLCGMSNPLKLM